MPMNNRPSVSQPVQSKGEPSVLNFLDRLEVLGMVYHPPTPQPARVLLRTIWKRLKPEEKVPTLRAKRKALYVEALSIWELRVNDPLAGPQEVKFDPNYVPPPSYTGLWLEHRNSKAASA